MDDVIILSRGPDGTYTGLPGSFFTEAHAPPGNVESQLRQGVERYWKQDPELARSTLEPIFGHVVKPVSAMSIEELRLVHTILATTHTLRRQLQPA